MRFVRDHKTHQITKAFLIQKNKVGINKCLISNYTTEQQYSKQHGIGRKTDTQTNGTELRAQK